jgi:hypothetical protein
MDQSGVKPLINVAVKIEENMNRRITLCREHIVTVRFPNYKCILMHIKETHFYLIDTLDQVDLN